MHCLKTTQFIITYTILLDSGINHNVVDFGSMLLIVST